jgi:hypothetical protein
MRKLAILSLFTTSCLLVPDNEGTLTFNYLILQQDGNGQIGALLCDNPDINPAGTPFVKSQVATILITGVSRRGLTTTREAECFYDVPSGDIDSEQELGALSVGFPADTYQSFKIQLLNSAGTPVIWRNDLALNFVQENEILLNGTTVNLEPAQTLDLGPTLVQLGEDGAVADELRIFVQ